jgi:hypothetical protein
MSSIRRAWRCRASTTGQGRIGSIPRSHCAFSSAFRVASADTAALQRAQEAAISTLESVDAKRPGRARAEESLQAIPEGSLVGESTRLVPFDGSPRIKGICRASLRNMKSALTRLGVRAFKQKLRKAPEGLEALRTPEDTRILQNTRVLRTRTCRSREILVLKPARRTLRRLSAHQGPLMRFAQERRCPDLSYGCDAAAEWARPSELRR